MTFGLGIVNKVNDDIDGLIHLAFMIVGVVTLCIFLGYCNNVSDCLVWGLCLGSRRGWLSVSASIAVREMELFRRKTIEQGSVFGAVYVLNGKRKARNIQPWPEK